MRFNGTWWSQVLDHLSLQFMQEEKKKGNTGPKLARHPLLRLFFVKKLYQRAITNIWCVLVKSVCKNLLHIMCEIQTFIDVLKMLFAFESS